MCRVCLTCPPSLWSLTAQQLQQGDAFRSIVNAAQQQALGQGTSAAGNVKRRSSGAAADQPAATAAAKAPSGSQQPSGGRGVQSAAPTAAQAMLSGSPAKVLSRSAQPLPPDEPQEVELSLLPSRSYALDAPDPAFSGPALGGSDLAADSPSQAARPATMRRRSASLPYPHADTGRRCRRLACCSAAFRCNFQHVKICSLCVGGAAAELPKLRVSASDAGDGGKAAAQRTDAGPQPAGAWCAVS